MRFTKKVTLFAVLSALFGLAIGLLTSIPSHPECGTERVDMLPCAYWDRVWWGMDNGGWMIPLVVWLAINVTHAIILWRSDNKQFARGQKS